jgi:hypothetical protein
VTGNDSWCFQFNPEMKLNNTAWNGVERILREERLQKYHVKTMLFMFVKAARIIHCMFVPEGITMNSHCYLELMEHLYVSMHHLKNENF